MKKTMKPATLLMPLPAVLVSCGNLEKPNIITIAWTGIVNSTPPMTYISVRKSRYSHDLIAESGEFVINLTTEALTFATDYCGVKSGREVDKFTEMKLTPLAAGEVSCPMIAESPINLECKVREVHEYPSHDMFVAEIVAVHVDEELIDEKGRFEMEKAGLMAYVHGQYFGIKKQPLGRFGYAVMKPKTKKKISRAAHQKRVQQNQEKRRAKSESKQASRQARTGQVTKKKQARAGRGESSLGL